MKHPIKKPGGEGGTVEILALVLQHDKQAVQLAVAMALTSGMPPKMHDLNLLRAKTGSSAD